MYQQTEAILSGSLKKKKSQNIRIKQDSNLSLLTFKGKRAFNLNIATALPKYGLSLLYSGEMKSSVLG